MMVSILVHNIHPKVMLAKCLTHLFAHLELGGWAGLGRGKKTSKAINKFRSLD